MTMDYSPQEMMAIMAAREIRNEDIVFCGTGISMVAAMAAKHISAPQSIIFFETGGIDCELHELPLSVADPRVMFGTTINAGLAESFAVLQNPRTGPRVVAIIPRITRVRIISTRVNPFNRRIICFIFFIVYRLTKPRSRSLK